jgi:hypothetical protein
MAQGKIEDSWNLIDGGVLAQGRRNCGFMNLLSKNPPYR